MKNENHSIYKEYSNSTTKIKVVDIPVNSDLWRYIERLSKNNIKFDIDVKYIGRRPDIIWIINDYCKIGFCPWDNFKEYFFEPIQNGKNKKERN